MLGQEPGQVEPALDVKERQAAVIEAVGPRDALAVPNPEVPAGSESNELRGRSVHPCGEPEVVSLAGKPPVWAHRPQQPRLPVDFDMVFLVCRKRLRSRATDVETDTRTIDLLGDQELIVEVDIPGLPRHLSWRFAVGSGLAAWI